VGVIDHPARDDAQGRYHEGERLRRVGYTIEYSAVAHDPAVLADPWAPPVRVLRRSTSELEEPPRCEERDLAHMVDPTQYHENPR
jgi:hypothetical protein